jgi:membrane protease YdiL (CAAX protease family)
MTAPPTPPGWYADPGGATGWRWWDGAAWTAHSGPPTPSGPPPGWYADPWAASPERWWDGRAWTGYTGPPPPERPWFPPRGATDDQVGVRGGGLALAGFLVAELLATGVAVALLVAGVSSQSVVLLLLSQLGLWAGLFGACVLAVRRHGHGSLRELGLSGIRAQDVGVGLLAAFIGRLATVVLVAPFIPLLPTKTVRGTSLTNGLTSSTLTAVVLALIVAIGAPFFEELFFRGLVQSALTRRWGARVGVFAQAGFFAVAHYQVGMGLAETLITFLTIGVLGVYLGVLRWRYQRLGPGMVTHAAFNLVAVLLVFAVR